MNGLLWGLHSYRRIGEAEVSAIRAGSKAAQAQRMVHDLEQRIDKLTVICMAMWGLLHERLSLTEEDLMERVKEIDLRDGQADGKITPTVAQCRQCGRVMSRTHSKCMYCGAEKLDIGPFDQVM